MLKSLRLAFVALLMLAPLAQAQKIAVVNSQMALEESDAAKKYALDTEKRFAPQIKLLKAAQEDIQKLQKQLQKDGPTLTVAQREQREVALKRKIEDFQLQDRQLKEENVRLMRAEQAKVIPKLEKAIDEVAKEQKYDIVLERGAARFIKPELDITRKVIERLNKMK